VSVGEEGVAAEVPLDVVVQKRVEDGVVGQRVGVHLSWAQLG
jgi:hypothetical protein